MPKNEEDRNDIIEVLKKATEPMGRAAIVTTALAKAGKASDAELPLRQMKDEAIKQTGERRTAVTS